MLEAQHALPTRPLATWRRFWERGDWWRALLLAAVYYGVYQLLSLLVGAIFGTEGGVRGAKGSAMDVFIGTALPILLGAVLLLGFALSLGWLRELFGPQPVRGRRWMWVGIAVVLAINVSALLSLDFNDAGTALIASWLLTGLFVGLAEELLTRGFVVNLMRKAGHGEIAVALVSAAIFGALHAGNSNAGGLYLLLRHHHVPRSATDRPPDLANPAACVDRPEPISLQRPPDGGESIGHPAFAQHLPRDRHGHRAAYRVHRERAAPHPAPSP